SFRASGIPAGKEAGRTTLKDGWHMGARAHVLIVSVSLGSLITTGCIFGGKKKVPHAKAVTAPSELDAELDPRAAAKLPKGAHALKAERNAGALAELPRHSGAPA